MIVENLINLILFPVTLLLNTLPSMSFSIPEGVFNGLNSILGLLGFIFPIKGLFTILLTSFSIKLFQFLWAVVLRVKSFIPGEGN